MTERRIRGILQLALSEGTWLIRLFMGAILWEDAITAGKPNYAWELQHICSRYAFTKMPPIKFLNTHITHPNNYKLE